MELFSGDVHGYKGCMFLDGVTDLRESVYSDHVRMMVSVKRILIQKVRTMVKCCKKVANWFSITTCSIQKFW